MKRKAITLLIPLFACFTFSVSVRAESPTGSIPSPADSVGIEKKDGKRYILHRVDEGQTLYAISRRYGQSVADIRAANPDMTDALRYSQIIRIPVPDGTLSRKEEKQMDKAIRKQEKEEKQAASTDADKGAAKTDDPARAGIHVVQSGQTLYSLAGRYGVSQADLRKWNGLPGDNVLIGQALIVSEKAYQARNPAFPTDSPTPPAHAAENRPATPVDVATRPAETRPIAPAEAKPDHRTERTGTNEPAPRSASTASIPAKPAEPEIELPRPGNDAPMPTRGRRVSSSGVAEMIEGNDGSGKYLALHRSAPIGTLVQVRNEFNNQSLWVKVIGRLPDTGVNDKILIKLSTQAFTKLSPQDRRFRAEVSYISR